MNNAELQSLRDEVLVVGVGPVGLVSALALRARDRSVTILEAEPEDRSRPGSRAIFVHKASLQLLEKIQPGLGYEIASHGLVWRKTRTSHYQWNASFTMNTRRSVGAMCSRCHS